MQSRVESDLLKLEPRILQDQKRNLPSDLRLALTSKCCKRIKNSLGVNVHWNLHKLKNLKSLSFSDYQIYKNKFHSKLLYVMRQLKGLRKIKIYSTQKYLFRNNSLFDNKSLISLSSSLKNLKEMRYLEIYIANGCIIQDRSFISFAKSLKYLRQLTALKLNFNMMTQITDDSVTCLNRVIPKTIKCLELKIKSGTYWDTGNLKGKSLNQLGKSLKYKRELQCLSLAFFQFNDVSIVALADAIKYLEKLIMLDIDFSNSNIHDFGFFRLIRSLQNLRNLTALSLDFYRCNQLRIATVLELERILLLLKQLEKLNLRFSEIDYSRYTTPISNTRSDNLFICKLENKCVNLRDYFENVIFQLSNLKEYDVQIS